MNQIEIFDVPNPIRPEDISRDALEREVLALRARVFLLQRILKEKRDAFRRPTAQRATS